jgi:hypothetical protein
VRQYVAATGGQYNGNRRTAMTIEIHRPELEALIRDWMKTGAFPTVEDALIQALKSSPFPAEHETVVSSSTAALTGADLVAIMQASPYKEIDLEPARDRLPVRDVGF